MPRSGVAGLDAGDGGSTDAGGGAEGLGEGTGLGGSVEGLGAGAAPPLPPTLP